MQTYRGVVQDGRVIFDNPLGLPNGAEVTVVVPEPERDEIDQAWADAHGGEIISVEQMRERMKRDRAR